MKTEQAVLPKSHLHRLTRTIIGVFLVAGLSVPVWSQEWIHTEPPAGALRSVAYNPHNTDEVIGINPFRQFFRSLDGGYHWALLPGERPQGLSSYTGYVFHPTLANVRYLFDYNGLFRSDDNGASWIDISPPAAEHFTHERLVSVAPSMVYAVGWAFDEDPVLYGSEDFGATWDSLTVRTGITTWDVDPFDSDHLVMITGDSLLESTDRGEHWAPLLNDMGDVGGWYLEDIQFDRARPDTLYLRLNDGIDFTDIYRITGDTLRWEDIVSNGVAMTSYSTGQLVTRHEVHYQLGNYRLELSLDGGATWREIGSDLPYSGHFDGTPARQPSVTLHPTDPATMILSNNVNLFVSSDTGATRGSLAEGIAPAIAGAIRSLPDGGLRIRTLNGQVWETPGLNDPWTPLNWNFVADMDWLDSSPDTVFIAGQGVKRSVDGGQTWEAVLPSDYADLGHFVKILPSDPDVVFAWYGGHLFRSTDGGSDWIQQPDLSSELPRSGGPFAVDPLRPGRLWTFSDTLFVTEDFGATWTAHGPALESVYDMICLPGRDDLMFLDQMGDLWLYTEDTGEVSSLPTPISNPLHDLKLRPGTDHEVLVIGDTRVYLTDDYGSTWEEIAGDYSGATLGLGLSEDGTDLYVGTAQTGLWVGIDVFEPSGVANGAEPSLPARITLHPAYPNPFNASTRIAFDLPQAGRATLSVYDLLGRRVAVLFEGNADAGRHEVVWDVANEAGVNVASGTYLVRLEGQDDPGAVRRVVLVK